MVKKAKLVGMGVLKLLKLAALVLLTALLVLWFPVRASAGG